MRKTLLIVFLVAAPLFAGDLDLRIDAARWKAQIDIFRATNPELWRDFVRAVNAIDHEYEGGGFGEKWLNDDLAKRATLTQINNQSLRDILITGSLLRLAQARQDQLILSLHRDKLQKQLDSERDQSVRTELSSKIEECDSSLRKFDDERSALQKRIETYAIGD